MGASEALSGCLSSSGPGHERQGLNGSFYKLAVLFWGRYGSCYFGFMLGAPASWKLPNSHSIICLKHASNHIGIFSAFTVLLNMRMIQARWNRFLIGPRTRT